MAVVTIDIKDTTPGCIDIRFDSEPAWPGPAAEDQYMTTAQQAGLMVIQAMPNIQEYSRGRSDGKAKVKIQLVDEDIESNVTIHLNSKPDWPEAEEGFTTAQVVGAKIMKFLSEEGSPPVEEE